MKFLAVLLSACILFLSFSGMITPVQPPAKKICCDQMTGKSACHQHKKQDPKKDCEDQGCTMMFSCSVCGFLIVEPLRIQANFSTYLPKPVSLYKIGDLTAYHSPDWKPPKAC